MFQAAIIAQLIKLGIVVIGGVVLLRFIKKKSDDARFKKSDAKVKDEMAVSQAIAIRAALNPAKFGFLRELDGAEVGQIMNIARQIKDLTAVAAAYAERYAGSSVHDDLQHSLGAEKYQAFIALAGGANNTTVNYNQVKTGIERGLFVRTMLETNARSTPKKKGYFEKSNILKTFPKFKLIGITTGKTEYDGDNDIIFIQVHFVTRKKETVQFWVARSQVEIFTKAEKDNRKNGGENFSVDYISGIPKQTPQLITKHNCTVYDEQLLPITQLSANVLLGTPLHVASTNNGTFVLFADAEGEKCWCRAEDVNLWKPDNKTA
jgi:hypothetical protein